MEEPCAGRRLYHSGAARDDRDRCACYSAHKAAVYDRKQGGTVEPYRFTPELYQG